MLTHQPRSAFSFQRRPVLQAQELERKPNLLHLRRPVQQVGLSEGVLWSGETRRCWSGGAKAGPG